MERRMTPGTPPKGVVQISDDFWNIRGSYKVRGLVEIGTHVSLVRLGSGRFVFLDSYSLEGPAREFVDALTDGGEDLEAVINLHPFHTMHVRRMHALYRAAGPVG